MNQTLKEKIFAELDYCAGAPDIIEGFGEPIALVDSTVLAYALTECDALAEFGPLNSAELIPYVENWQAEAIEKASAALRNL